MAQIFCQLSCLIKSDEGVTSTAVSASPVYGGDNFGAAFRITQHQLHNGFPESFTLQDLVTGGHIDNTNPENQHLLVNTGCMICRLDKSWAEEVYFTINDRIKKDFGKMYTQVEPEDWFFSRMVAQKGGKVTATKSVKVQHLGTTAFHSDRVWGSEFDPHFLVPPKN